MAAITVNTITIKKEWEDFLKIHPEANFLQSWYWGEFHNALGKQIERTGFYKEKKLVGVMLSIIENAKRGRYMTVPGGPIINWQDKKIVDMAVSEMKKIAKMHRCVFVRVRPQIPSDATAKYIFKQHHFINAPTHLHAELTSQLDVTLPEETLLANMRKATRYEVRKAINQKIEIKITDDPAAIQEFYDVQLQTAKRQKFVPFSYKFLYEQFQVFAKADKALLYSALLEGKLLAQAFVIFYGQEAAYHYGAGTDEGRKYPGAYLIQWEAIKEAKKRGIKIYNFWGVAPPEQKDHRFAGISIFKRGFGGVDFAYLHAQDLIIDYPRYFLNYCIESLRKYMRHV